MLYCMNKVEQNTLVFQLPNFLSGKDAELERKTSVPLMKIGRDW